MIVFPLPLPKVIGITTSVAGPQSSLASTSPSTGEVARALVMAASEDVIENPHEAKIDAIHPLAIPQAYCRILQ